MSERGEAQAGRERDPPIFGVLGPSGYLGASFVDFLLSRGERVDCWLRNRSAKKLNRRLRSSRQRLICNFDDPIGLPSLRPLIERSSSLFNFIGLVDLRSARTRDEEMIALNGLLPGLIASWIRQVGREREVLFIYPSSQRVHLIRQRPLVRAWIERALERFESDQSRCLQAEEPVDALCELAADLLRVNPLPERVNSYDVSKLLGEACASQSRRHCIVRISSVYGPAPEARGFVQRAVEARIGGQPIEESCEVRDFLYEDDLNEILHRLPFRARAGDLPPIIEVASGERVRCTQVVRLIENLTPRAYGSVVFRGGGDGHPVSDNRVARVLLNRAFTPFEEGLRRTVVSYENRLGLRS